MKIEKIVYQHRRDFKAIYVCEHCGAKKEGYGYDDANFHQNVIPEMKCQNCSLSSPNNYRQLATKYPDSTII